MDSTNFNTLATKTIQIISDGIESSDKDYKIDIDLIEGILQMEMPNGGQYVINKHSASSQIWVSSPVSGASHFSYNEDKKEWVDSKGSELFGLIKNEVKQSVGIEVSY